MSSATSKADRVAAYLAKSAPPDLPTAAKPARPPEVQDAQDAERIAARTACGDRIDAVYERKNAGRATRGQKARAERLLKRAEARDALLNDAVATRDLLGAATGGVSSIPLRDEYEAFDGEEYQGEADDENPDDLPGVFTLGSQLWKERVDSKKPRTWNEPEEMWREACLYFEWMTSNPLIEHKVAQYKGYPVKMLLPKMRAMSLTSLCLFLRISVASWKDYRGRDEFLAVTQQVEEVIRGQKFEGAAGDMLNAMIISRDLGLTEKTDITSGGAPLTRIERVIVPAKAFSHVAGEELE